MTNDLFNDNLPGHPFVMFALFFFCPGVPVPAVVTAAVVIPLQLFLFHLYVPFYCVLLSPNLSL